MGYYTHYQLEWEPTEPEVEIYLEARKDTFYGINADGSSSDSCKWYEHEEDMTALSKQFPRITFTLSGEGEQQVDMWRKRFIDGQMEWQRVPEKYSEWRTGPDPGRNWKG